ncbi:MAG: Succinate--CoA ligase [ADP-forming] subunit alpha [bacterium]|nr:Succinate--CoA ligase [ADP-forming] subunit alpha [bacterium]
MSILVNADTKVIVQGMTGREGSFHTRLMREYGTRVVGGVTPGKGGTTHEEVPIFNTVREAREQTQCDATVIFVPPPFCADAIEEAIAAEIPVIVAITEGVPTKDMVRVFDRLNGSRSRLIGPNCPGLITPPSCKLGIIPGGMFTEGTVGIVSRSGTLTYEIANELFARKIGVSTCVGIGGDPVLGTTFKDVLPLFQEDTQTEIIVMVGEIGGSDEQVAVQQVVDGLVKKPVIGFIGGRTAPPGKRMGHAGAIVSGHAGTAQAKVDAMEAAGIPVANTIEEIGALVAERLAARV